ncbi:FtsW/RodA/SpoVE family cell cycle protein, partial [Thermoproteota archaeon]
MIYSSSSIYAWNAMGDSFYYLKRQLIYLVCGFILMFLVMSIEHNTLRKLAKPLFFLSLLLLILNLMPGISHQASGARRWLRIGPFGFQPSELIKVTFIIYLADFISRRKDGINNFFHGLLPPLISLGIPVFLILLQPDLGTAVSLVCIATIMLFSAGLSYKYFCIAGASALPILYFLIYNIPYRRARILA